MDFRWSLDEEFIGFSALLCVPQNVICVAKCATIHVMMKTEYGHHKIWLDSFSSKRWKGHMIRILWIPHSVYQSLAVIPPKV